MNKNIEVLSVDVDESYKIMDVDKIYDMAFAPIVVLYNRDDHRKLIDSLNEWFKNRTIPYYRDELDSLLSRIGISNTYELAYINFGLSLSDQYWLKPIDLSLDWDDINYFNNDYDSKELFDMTFGEYGHSSIKHKRNYLSTYDTPNYTLAGQLKKTWINKDDINYLYKASSSLYNLEPINEVISSKICKILEVPYVNYELEYIHTKRNDSIVSVCECMINEDEEFIPAYQVIANKNIDYTVDDYYIYLKELIKHRVPRAKEYLEKMLILDYIMLNEDRHLNNFGVIRNVNNLKWTRICPIFDTGRSLNTNISKSYWNFELGEVKCFTKEFVSSEVLLKFVEYKLNDKQLNELIIIPSIYKSLLKEYQSYLKLYDEDIEVLSNGLEHRVRKIIKFMQNLLA